MLINFVVHVICAKLELQVLKVGRISTGWIMLAARLVRAPLGSNTMIFAVLLA